MNRVMVVNGMSFQEVSSFIIPSLSRREFVCRSNGDGIYFSPFIKRVLSPFSDKLVDNTSNRYIFSGTKALTREFSIISISFDKQVKKVLILEIFENYCKIFKKNLNDISLLQNQVVYYFVNDIDNSVNQSILMLAKSDERKKRESNYIVFNGINKGEKIIRVETLNDEIVFIKDKKLSNFEYFLIVPK